MRPGDGHDLVDDAIGRYERANSVLQCAEIKLAPETRDLGCYMVAGPDGANGRSSVIAIAEADGNHPLTLWEGCSRPELADDRPAAFEIEGDRDRLACRRWGECLWLVLRFPPRGREGTHLFGARRSGGSPVGTRAFRNHSSESLYRNAVWKSGKDAGTVRFCGASPFPCEALGDAVVCDDGDGRCEVQAAV